MAPNTVFASPAPVVDVPANDRRRSDSPRCAYVTFLDGDNRGYIDGAFAIARALRLHGSRYPLVVAATPSVPQDALEKMALLEPNVTVRPIKLLELPDNYAKDGTGVLLYQQFLANFSKLRMWEFCDEWDKLVYLDSDVLPMTNIDDMFLAPHFSAAQDNMVPDSLVSASDCQAPGPLNKAPNANPRAAYFNAGVFVFEPSLEELAELMTALQGYTISRYAEQDFLNDFYRGRWNMLPLTYNWGRVNFFVCPELYNPSTVKVVHFSGPAKPWRRGTDGSWPTFNDICEEEKALLVDPESQFSKAVDKWWVALNYYDNAVGDDATPEKPESGYCVSATIKTTSKPATTTTDLLSSAVTELARTDKANIDKVMAVAA